MHVSNFMHDICEIGKLVALKQQDLHACQLLYGIIDVSKHVVLQVELGDVEVTFQSAKTI